VIYFVIEIRVLQKGAIMHKKEIIVSTSDQRFTSFFINEGEVSPYFNYILAFKWYRMGELNPQSWNKMHEFFEEKEMNL